MEKSNFTIRQDFLARIYLLTPEEGGRKTPVWLGYRPQVYFPTEICDEGTSGSWNFMEKEKLSPGETTKIGIALLRSDFFKNKLLVGMPLILQEGGTQVGRGEILEIYNLDLIFQPAEIMGQHVP